MTFDRETIRALRTQIEAALSEVAKKNGVSFSIGAISFRDSEFSTRLKCSSKADGFTDDSRNEKAKKAFEAMASFYGFKETDLGAKVNLMGSAYEITGLMPRSRKFPVLAKALRTGKTYKFTANDVLLGLGREIPKFPYNVPYNDSFGERDD